MQLKTVLATIVAATLAFGVVDDAIAKDKGKPDKSKKVKVEGKPDKGNGNAKGPKAVPPGQIKRYTRGAKLPDDLKFEELGDLNKWKLKPLGPGEKYIRVDNEVLKIAEDTQTVIDAVGIVGDLLK